MLKETENCLSCGFMQRQKQILKKQNALQHTYLHIKISCMLFILNYFPVQLTRVSFYLQNITEMLFLQTEVRSIKKTKMTHFGQMANIRKGQQ